MKLVVLMEKLKLAAGDGGERSIFRKALSKSESVNQKGPT